MKITSWLLMRLRGVRGPFDVRADHAAQSLSIESLIQAHGDWLAFLATILERERVITSADLSRSLSEFAVLTAADRPDEGHILSFWASRLQDASASLRDDASIH